MNTWELRKIAIVESDDFQDKYDRNGLEMLFYWKAKFPKFKITLFTIPNKTSPGMLELISKHSDWIELAWHGWDHDSNFECWEWDYDKTIALAGRLNGQYKKIFKAPGWTITDRYSGYVADTSLPVAKDPQAVYKALTDLGYTIVDRHYNVPARPENSKIICIDCQPDFVHSHTWDMVTGDLNGKNGFRQIEELHGVPWDNQTDFYFITEALEKGLVKPCQK